MKNKLLKCIYKLWVYVLNNIQIQINKKIENDEECLYVVYLSHLNDDLYICKNGKDALELYNLLNKVNIFTNRIFIKVIYGKVDIVFKYKMPKLTDVIFTWNASPEEKKNVYDYIRDTPIRKI